MSSNMENLNLLTASQLRDKLLEHGYDIPSSISKDFMIKKLQKVLSERRSTTPGRKSVAPTKTPRKSETPTSVPVPSAQVRSLNNSRGRTPPRSTRQSIASANVRTRQSLGVGGRGGDVEEDTTASPQERSTPGRSTTRMTRHSLQTMTSRLSSPPTSRTRMNFPAYGDNDEDDEDDDEEPMSQSGAWTYRQQPAQVPMRSSLSLRPSPLKRARQDDSPSPSPQSTLSPSLQNTTFVSSMGSRLGTKAVSIFNRTYSSPPVSTSFQGGFGLIVNGRKVQTDSIPNDEANPKKFIFNVPEADSVQFVVVFLPENQQFAPGTAGQIYFGWPDERNEIKWHELGHISNIRPSAIFNVTAFKQAVTASTAGNQRFAYGIFPPSTNNTGRPLSGPTTAQIGVSIENLDVIVSSLRPQVQLD